MALVVRKAYVVDSWGGVRHGLAERTFMFVPTYGWMTRQCMQEYRIVELPREYTIGCDLWDYHGWWGDNWANDLWSWCYGHGHKQGNFQPVRKQGDAYYAA